MEWIKLEGHCCLIKSNRNYMNLGSNNSISDLDPPVCDGPLTILIVKTDIFKKLGFLAYLESRKITKVSGSLVIVADC